MLGAVGCGSVSQSYSVSPLSFLLPGIVQNDPQPNDKAAEPAVPDTAPLFASK